MDRICGRREPDDAGEEWGDADLTAPRRSSTVLRPMGGGRNHKTRPASSAPPAPSSTPAAARCRSPNPSRRERLSLGSRWLRPRRDEVTDFDGVDLIRRLRAWSPVPVVIVSARGQRWSGTRAACNASSVARGGAGAAQFGAGRVLAGIHGPAPPQARGDSGPSAPALDRAGRRLPPCRAGSLRAARRAVLRPFRRDPEAPNADLWRQRLALLRPYGSWFRGRGRKRRPDGAPRRPCRTGVTP
jgi:hypothetical protein